MAIEPEPVGVANQTLRADAQERVVNLPVVWVHVVSVVGHQQRQVQGLGDAQQIVAEFPLNVDAVIHQLAEVVFWAQDVAHIRGNCQRLVVVARLQPPVDLTRWTTGSADQTLAVLVQQVPIEPRRAVETFDTGAAG